jgi:hypothetical protein
MLFSSPKSMSIVTLLLNKRGEAITWQYCSTFAGWDCANKYDDVKKARVIRVIFFMIVDSIFIVIVN